MSAHDFDTHRCDGLLRAHCSIRKYKYDGMPKKLQFYDGCWHLYEQYADFDWDYIGMREVAPILFCPWCGKEL